MRFENWNIKAVRRNLTPEEIAAYGQVGALLSGADKIAYEAQLRNAAVLREDLSHTQFEVGPSNPTIDIGSFEGYLSAYYDDVDGGQSP